MRPTGMLQQRSASAAPGGGSAMAQRVSHLSAGPQREAEPAGLDCTDAY